MIDVSPEIDTNNLYRIFRQLTEKYFCVKSQRNLFEILNVNFCNHFE